MVLSIANLSVCEVHLFTLNFAPIIHSKKCIRELQIASIKGLYF